MNIITKVKKLDLPLGQYVVIGSGIMAQLGLRAANDVDIAVTPDLCARYARLANGKRQSAMARSFSKKRWWKSTRDLIGRATPPPLKQP